MIEGCLTVGLIWGCFAGFLTVIVFTIVRREKVPRQENEMSVNVWEIEAKKQDILVDPKKRMYCDDFGDRNGCLQEIKIIENNKGRKIACNPVQLPCLDREGNTVWVYVPHWMTCPDSRQYFVDFMTQKAKEQYDYAQDRARNNEPTRVQV